jgi:hypothetical protein
MQHKQEVRWIQLPVRLEASQAELLTNMHKQQESTSRRLSVLQ